LIFLLENNHLGLPSTMEFSKQEVSNQMSCKIWENMEFYYRLLLLLV